MTAINVIRQRNAVHVITDGAMIDGQGCMVQVSSKVASIVHLNSVIALRGAKALLPIMAVFFGDHGHDAPQMFVRRLRDLCRPAEELWRQQFGPDGADFELVVASISDAGPQSWFVTSHDRAGVTPWQPYHLSETMLTPGTVDLQARTPSPDAFDPDRDGLALLEAQRAMMVPTGSAGTIMRIVGGFAQVTTITRSEIVTRIIHKWPDRLGEKIEPRSTEIGLTDVQAPTRDIRPAAHPKSSFGLLSGTALNQQKWSPPKPDRRSDCLISAKRPEVA